MDDKVFEEAKKDVSLLMASLFVKYESYPGILAQALTDSLGGLIAIAAKDPKAGLRASARRLLQTNVATIRAAHFGYKLGVKEPEIAKTSEVIHIGGLTRKPT